MLRFYRKHECTQVVGPKHGESTYNYENNWQRRINMAIEERCRFISNENYVDKRQYK